MSEQVYIVTVEHIARIVQYCVQMTLHGGGDNLRKDWIPNVEEAIGLNGTRSTTLDKIILVGRDRDKVKKALTKNNTKSSKAHIVKEKKEAIDLNQYDDGNTDIGIKSK